MGAIKKYKDNYPQEEGKAVKKKNSIEDKRLIQAYINRITKLLKEPQNQKKAAEILSQMINSKK